MNNEEKDLVTVREAARQYGRSPETVRRWIWDGKLPAQKLGNQLFVKRNDLERFGQTQSDDEERAARKAARLAALQALVDIGERSGGGVDVVEALERHRTSDPEWQDKSA